MSVAAILLLIFIGGLCIGCVGLAWWLQRQQAHIDEHEKEAI